MNIARFGLLLGALLLLALSGCNKKLSPVGGPCSDQDDCINHNDCLKTGSGKGTCTVSCLTFPKDDCPAGTTCQKINLSISAGSKDLGNVAGVMRCLPASAEAAPK